MAASAFGILNEAIARKVARELDKSAEQGAQAGTADAAAADPSAIATGPAVDDKGGSFCLAPAGFLPSGRLEKYFQSGLIYTMDFDVGVSKHWSVIFGGGYTDLEGKVSKDQRLMIAPAWLGIKLKAQFDPSVEVFWDIAGAGYYEKSYHMRTGVGAVENLGGGGIFGAGFDVWLTKWLLAGVESKFHFIFEPGQAYTAAQLGIRLGVRG